MNNGHAGNRRGERSREEILDAASRVMAARGYAGASISALVAEAGVPKSAIYHHFHSKGGLLSAVMARGAQGFFDGMRTAHAEPPEGGEPRDRLAWYLQRTGEVFAANPDFLRLHMLLILSSEAVEAEVADIIHDVRAEGRAYMNEMIRSAFAAEGPTVARAVADELDYFGIAGFDGAFIASQAESDRSVTSQMSRLADALAALGEAVVARIRG
ncbi:TetR/AcrR family transcriptional regulator [Raineyella sp. LH-20]|uniref:TetR/AcrR family transcriptional regulator n=1 Tax=Raineyella sp. LH-20 TaxID=3081204 RepID=UPI002952D937|nr:TetR/AcrR family transcriptional regulator [Raineyella sp. LH-20]WOP18666.1 TetR/AcrR family transcriptional regulator [Raineyella sp. LH-20]